METQAAAAGLEGPSGDVAQAAAAPRPASAHAAGAARNGSVDLLRFIGACGIVLFHLNLPYGWLGLSALPMFVTLLVFYGAGRPLLRSARRLLVPFAIWSAVYAAAKALQAVLAGRPVASEFEWWMLLTGPAIHLWFLPFCALFLALFAKPFERLGRGPRIVLAGTLAAAVAWGYGSGPLPIPLAQWITVLPAALLGLVMADAERPSLMAAGFAVLAGALLVADPEAGTWQMMIGSGAIALALALPLPSTHATRWLSDISLGVYLIHPLVIALALMAGVRDGLVLLPLAILGAMALTVALRRVLPSAV